MPFYPITVEIYIEGIWGTFPRQPKIGEEELEKIYIMYRSYE
jgi:hypothetical protein